MSVTAQDEQQQGEEMTDSQQENQRRKSETTTSSVGKIKIYTSKLEIFLLDYWQR
jgi:hypothetical protein